jgi:hypothetical protein
MRLDRDGDFTDLIHGFLQNGSGDQKIKVLAGITEGFFFRLLSTRKGSKYVHKPETYFAYA